MNRAALTFVASLALPFSAFGQSSEIYLCVDESGQKSFQNTGNTKGCKRLDTQPVLTVPAPRLPARAVVTSERVTVSPASFPRVDGETQRTRDSDRRRILEDELRAEEEKLGRLKGEFNNGEPERRGDERNYALYRERSQRLSEDIARSETNIVSLRRELSLLRTQ